MSDVRGFIASEERAITRSLRTTPWQDCSCVNTIQ